MPTEHFTRQIPALYNGVSQQPATVRLPSQAEEVVNCLQTVVDGVRKRPPTQHLAKLTATPPTSAFLHTINRDTTERYSVVITDGDLKVYNMAGAEKTVSFPHGKGYLDVVNAETDFAAVGVADFTFIVNKTKRVAMLAAEADTVSDPTDYWWLNRVEVSGGPIAGAVGNIRLAIQQQYIARQPGGTFRGDKQTLQDLPETPINGDIYRIRGNADSNFSTYYVVRNGGVWEETVAPNLKNKLDATTMPHALVRKADGTFEFGPFSWASRRVGDEVTSKNPSFVGRVIRDVFFTKNRLVFLSDESFIMSAADDYGRFYRNTVTDILADDPVDSAVATSKVNVLNFGLPFNNATLLFSDQTQFMLTSEGITTSGSLSADTATEYECSKVARPAALGSNAYFASENGDYAKVWEYFVREDGVATDAADITAHCPKYIPAGVRKLATSTEHDSLALLTSGAKNRVYFYKMYWQADEKAQSSWSHWEFPATDEVLNVDILDDFIYFVIKRSDGMFLERMTLQAGAHPAGVAFDVLLDRRVALAGTFLTLENKTEFVLPYVYDPTLIRIVRGGQFSTPGSLANPATYEFPSATTVKVPGNIANWTCYAGQTYTQLYTFSEQFVQNAQGIAVNTGRLQLRSMTVYFVDTAYFQTQIDPYGDASQVELTEVVPSQFSEFTGKTIGLSALITGAPVFTKGAYTFQLYSPATSARISLVNDTHVNATFQKAEVEMFYFNRSRT